MTVYPMLVGLLALLAGLAIGKAWERYKLRDGQWIDRRKARESPHFIVGLDLVVANSRSGTVSVLLGNGSGTFRPAVDYVVGGGPSSIAIEVSRLGHIVSSPVSRSTRPCESISLASDSTTNSTGPELG